MVKFKATQLKYYTKLPKHHTTVDSNLHPGTVVEEACKKMQGLKCMATSCKVWEIMATI